MQAKANRGILYVDEVNLLDDGLVDVVLDSAASGVNTVEREGISIVHPAKFIMIGSGNPQEVRGACKGTQLGCWPHAFYWPAHSTLVQIALIAGGASTAASGSVRAVSQCVNHPRYRHTGKDGHGPSRVRAGETFSYVSLPYSGLNALH